nr:hypothetical protein [Tanacetum cinerariifolium]
AEAVKTACYVQNRVLVTKPHNKTLYELLHHRTPSIGFMRPFGCPVTILNTLDSLGKFEGKVDERFLVRYYVNSKAFRVFNSRTRIVQETLHVNFLENKPNIAGTGPTWLFDIDSLTRTMNYQPVTAGNQTNPSTDAAFDGKEPNFDAKKPESEVIVSPSSSAQSRKQDDKTKRQAKGKSPVESFTGYRDLSVEFEDYSGNSINDVNAVELEDITYSDEDDVGAEADFNNLETSITISHIPTSRVHKYHPVTQIMSDLSSTTQTRSMKKVVKDQGGLSQIFNDDFHTCMFAYFLLQEEPKRVLVNLSHGKRAIGTKWVFRNKKDKRGMVIRNKVRLIAQGHTQEEGIDYEEVFAPVARIEAIILFLAYASFMGFMMYQMDVKSAFLYGTIEEEVYVCQPPEFEDPDHPDKVYKVVKALYGLHQAPSAWQKGDILLVQIYVDDIIFGATNKDLCKSFKKLMKDKVNDVTRLQALVDKKKVVVTKAIIWEAHRLDDEEGVECLPNEEIFVELARMGYEKPSTKLTFYNAFFSSQLMRKEVADEAKEVVDEAKEVADAVKDVEESLQDQGRTAESQAEIYKSKGFFRVETPLFESMLVEQQVDEEGDADENVEEVNAGDAAEGDVSAAHGKVPTVVEEPSIASPTPPTPSLQPSQDISLTSQVQPTPPQSPQLKRRVKKLERRNKVRVLKLRRLQRVRIAQRVDTSNDTVMDDVSNQERMIVEIDQDIDVILDDDKEVVDDVKDVEESSQDQGRIAKSQAKIYKIDLDHANKLITKVVTAVSETIIAVSTNITAAEAQVPAVTLTDAPARVTTAPSRRRKGVVIRDPKEESTTFIIILAKTKSKDKGKGILIEEPKPLKKKQKIEQDKQYSRELQAELNKNIDWDEAINHVKRKAKKDPAMKRYQLLKALNRLNETLAERAAKRKKLDEEVEELKRHLQIVPNKDDDVYTEATPLARKIPVVDYQIIELNNKPYYKIIRADDTHQLYRNVHGPAKVKGWKLLESCGVQIITFTSTQLILLVERKYPLTRFTLDQMLNAVRLEVKKESKVSLKLLRLEEKHAKCLMLLVKDLVLPSKVNAVD